MAEEHQNNGPGPKPPWLKVRIGHGEQYARVRDIIRCRNLHTVCEEALCPNRGRCWQNGRATLMILGDTCSRTCRFCNVSSRRPSGCDTDEPVRVAEAVKALGLMDIVITSVTRDDLPDQGAEIWAETIRRVKEAVPGICLEVLIPDMGGDDDLLATIFRERPTILGHNLETVPSLYPTARPQADYARSLDVLRKAHEVELITKTGLMLGLGETRDEIVASINDVASIDCDILYMGQYLQPSKAHLPVKRYVSPDEFAEYRDIALEAGLAVVASEPLVRSSFYTEEQEAFVANAEHGKRNAEEQGEK